ncbi:glyoxalase-like domain-domain-containing protein [Coniella lustricola]|uniref:Glyoxalase-like domain-domain-containing protein n=1 Tax=Coniella lustricola TaxID=2025994 RepID=A0A2T3AL98_9PEZI|nr:glyoxalase-like domain-domain-containing protein [Coniella lustricola]
MTRSPNSAPVATVDHIILLVPHVTLLNLPSWLTSSFTVLPGGRHADGLTENSLVLFRDGVYLELVAFMPSASPPGLQQHQQKERTSHRWGARKEGTIVDWAVTASSEGELNTVRDRVAEKNRAALGGGHGGYHLRYSDPIPGGRTKPDGTQVRWVLSNPVVTMSWLGGGGGDDDDGSGGKVTSGEGEAPFWCLDKTPREVRVPYKSTTDSGEEVARHPSGALGVAKVVITVRGGGAGHGGTDSKAEGTWRGLKEVYDGLYGVEGVEVEDSESGDGTGHGRWKAYQWPFTVPDEEIAGTVGKTAERVVVLRIVAGGDMDEAKEASQDVSVDIQLALFSDSRDGIVGGELGGEDGERIEFELVKV